MAAPPHLIKLIRNNFVAYNIQSKLGNIDTKPVIDLIQNQSGDLNIGHKISCHNLNVNGFERKKK